MFYVPFASASMRLATSEEGLGGPAEAAPPESPTNCDPDRTPSGGSETHEPRLGTRADRSPEEGVLRITILGSFASARGFSALRLTRFVPHYRGWRLRKGRLCTVSTQAQEVHPRSAVPTRLDAWVLVSIASRNTAVFLMVCSTDTQSMYSLRKRGP